MGRRDDDDDDDAARKRAKRSRRRKKRAGRTSPHTKGARIVLPSFALVLCPIQSFFFFLFLFFFFCYSFVACICGELSPFYVCDNWLDENYGDVSQFSAIICEMVFTFLAVKYNFHLL